MSRHDDRRAFRDSPRTAPRPAARLRRAAGRGGCGAWLARGQRGAASPAAHLARAGLALGRHRGPARGAAGGPPALAGPGGVGGAGGGGRGAWAALAVVAVSLGSGVIPDYAGAPPAIVMGLVLYTVGTDVEVRRSVRLVLICIAVAGVTFGWAERQPFDVFLILWVIGACWTV